MTPFREPKVLEMGQQGDQRRFLVLMEVMKGEIVAGTFTINPIDELNSLAWAKALLAACERMVERAEKAEWLPPGSAWEDCK